jgi:hypothetical protein
MRIQIQDQDMIPRPLGNQLGNNRQTVQGAEAQATLFPGMVKATGEASPDAASQSILGGSQQTATR